MCEGTGLCTFAGLYGIFRVGPNPEKEFSQLQAKWPTANTQLLNEGQLFCHLTKRKRGGQTAFPASNSNLFSVMIGKWRSRE